MITTTARDKGWHPASRIAIGRALLAADSALCAAELGAAVVGDQSNVKKVADEMAEEGLLTRDRPTGGAGATRPGRVPAVYRLADAERGNLEAILAEKASPGALSRGQQLVVASIPDAKVADLKRVAAQAGASSQMEWVALVDGEPQECLMAFEGDRAVDLANDLIAQLAAAEIRSRRATVAQVLLGHRFASSRPPKPR